MARMADGSLSLTSAPPRPPSQPALPAPSPAPHPAPPPVTSPLVDMDLRMFGGKYLPDPATPPGAGTSKRLSYLHGPVVLQVS